MLAVYYSLKEDQIGALWAICNLFSHKIILFMAQVPRLVFKHLFKPQYTWNSAKSMFILFQLDITFYSINSKFQT